MAVFITRAASAHRVCATPTRRRRAGVCWRIRPERVTVSPHRRPAVDNAFTGEVESVYYLGAMLDIHVRLSPPDTIIAQIPNREDGFMPQAGDPVCDQASRAGAAIVFDGVRARAVRRRRVKPLEGGST